MVSADVAQRLADAEKALAASTRAQAQQRLLARAIGVVSSAGSTEQALQALTALLVPELTDVAAVWVLDEALPPTTTGTGREVSARSRAQPVAGARVERVAVSVHPRLSAVPLPPARTEHLPERSPLLAAMRAGRGHILSLANASLPAIASGSAAVAWTLGVGGHCVITVPLTNRGHVVGAMTLVACGDRPAYGPDDLARAEELAATAAVAVDRVQTFRRLRDTALTLQRSLLPNGPLDQPELAVAARYVPGAEDSEVGGDWYDVIPLGAGRTGLVIGDVMGRGVRAAAVMGQLRSATRAYARLELAPVELLERLDDLVHDLDPDQIVTAVYGIHDPASGTLTLACAGHPPPIVIEPDGRSHTVDVGSGAPLGLQAASFTEHEIDLHTGALLALYTDGLVETRRRDIDDGVASLADALARHCAADLPVLADKVLVELNRAQDDDIALLLARVPLDVRDPARRVSRLLLTNHPAVLGEVRRHTATAVASWALGREIGHLAALLVDELVTNALQHACGDIEVRLRHAPTSIVIEVCDGSREPPRRTRPAPDAEHGRGLHIVAALAARWGSRLTPSGKVVWCELDIGS